MTTAKHPCVSENTAMLEERDVAKKQIKELYFVLLYYLSRVLSIIQTHGFKPAWPVSTHTSSKNPPDETDLRLFPELFISPPVLHFHKHLEAGQFVQNQQRKEGCET